MLFQFKSRKAQIILALIVITFSAVTRNAEAGRDRGARCEKPDYISNGSYRIRRDRVMRITCNSGFVLQGPKTIDCIRGKWDGEKPVCAKKGCKKDLKQPKNGRIQIENDVKAILYCSDNHSLAGNRYAYCNGTIWDRPIGNCLEQKNVVQHECDFETDDICGWTYEPRDGLEWKRVMAANVFITFKTGPRHDHTTLTANGGHYMLMESLHKQNDDVILTSPIYDRSMSLKTACCFQFYYFMYGVGVGELLVVVKPVSLDLDDLSKNHKEFIKFQKNGNQNNIWNEAHFNIEELKEDFQILFVAKSGRGQLSDIAVDDVKLLTGDSCKALNDKEDKNLSDEEYDSTTYEAIFEMQSCVGHCFESSGSGLVRDHGHLEGLCNCDIDCEDNDTCCPDFRTACLNELFAQSTHVAEKNLATKRNEGVKNYTTTTLAATSTEIRATTKPTSTKIKTTQITIATTNTTMKSTSSTLKMIPTTIKTTATAASGIATTTRNSLTVKRAQSSTTLSTTIRNTTPRTVTGKTTLTTLRITAATTTSRKTTPLTKKSEVSTKATRKTSTTSKTSSTSTLKTTPTFTTTTTSTATHTFTSTHTPTTVRAPATTARNFSVHTSSRRPASKRLEYIRKDKSESDATSKADSSLPLYTFFLIVALILASVSYRRFADRASAWYMIHFKQNTCGDEDSSSITTSFEQQQIQTNRANGSLRAAWRNKIIKSTITKNVLKTPLVNEYYEDLDDDIAANGNITLTNKIYTEL